jgi:hypothetical protein
MANRDILERIDEHMARGNELMARITELTDDNRQFTGEMLRRYEIVATRATETMDRISAEMREVRRESTAGRQILVDLHQETLAQRQAIRTLIDELRERGLGRG